MLVCPECQWENLEEHQFCQKCGTSLTHKTCPECNSSVAWDAESCPNCGASTAIVWRAIVSLENNGNNSNLQLEGDYLDGAKRYRLKEKNQVELFKQFFSFPVIDTQPLQQSKLGLILAENSHIFPEIVEKRGEVFAKCPGIPSLAFPYLALLSFFPIIPEIQDAWQQEQQQVILISDYSHYQLLSHWWLQQELSLVEILYWLDLMAKLWQPLAEVGYSRSLLALDNLRIDLDESLCLKQLLPNTPEHEPSLADLAVTWQELLEAVPEPKASALLQQLLEQMKEGAVTTVEALHFKLKAIATSQEACFQDEDEIYSPLELEVDEYGQEETTTAIWEHGRDSDDIPTVVLPMQLLSLTDASFSDIGLQRQHNEDFFGVETEVKKKENSQEKTLQGFGLYIVCDGMGGHAAGEVASKMAVETLHEYFRQHWQDELPDEETIRQGIWLTNQKIYQINKDNQSSGSARMGTTLVMALVQDNQLAITSVGDSRIYRVSRKWGLEQLTIDHEVGQREILRGVEPEVAYARPDAYQLTQALGPRDNSYVNPDIGFFEINEDALLLLCSDGLSDHNLIETHWETHLLPLISSNKDLEQGVFQLVELGNEHNGHDNITAILVRIKVIPKLEQQSLL